MKVVKARKRRLPAGFVICPACDTGVQPVAMPQGPRCPVCRAEIPESTPKARQSPRPFEAKHQTRYFSWVDAAIALGFDAFESIYHVPNGGARNELEGARLKREGVRAGVLDINVDVPSRGYHGLRIELKATAAELGEKPRASTEQRRWIARHDRNGYAAVVREGAEAAWTETLDYLDLADVSALVLLPLQVSTRP